MEKLVPVLAMQRKKDPESKDRLHSKSQWKEEGGERGKDGGGRGEKQTL